LGGGGGGGGSGRPPRLSLATPLTRNPRGHFTVYLKLEEQIYKCVKIFKYSYENSNPRYGHIE
jgi:hypothetical protein